MVVRLIDVYRTGGPCTPASVTQDLESSGVTQVFGSASVTGAALKVHLRYKFVPSAAMFGWVNLSLEKE